MKKLLIIFLFLISISLNATKYYVSTTGNNGNPGTIGSTWLTWEYAFNNTPAGDTCYFRGGVYYISAVITIQSPGNDGTYSHPTCFFVYPADWNAGSYPVLDCANISGTPNERVGLAFRGVDHYYIKGLTLRNMYQRDDNDIARGIAVGWTASDALSCNGFTFENCTVYNVANSGFYVYFADTVRYINCDGYSCADSLTVYDPFGGSGGFGIADVPYINRSDSYVSYKGCRSWKSGDQGWGMVTFGTIILDSCWSINNGHFRSAGDDQMKGSGYKFYESRLEQQNSSVVQLTMRNCLAVDNEYRGFSIADDDSWQNSNYPEIRIHMYNNFAYRNGYTHELSPFIFGHGFWDEMNIDTVGKYDHKYANNLSYDNSGAPGWAQRGGVYQYGDYIPGTRHRFTNKFDSTGTTISNADFISLDTTGLCGPRQVDGSLPVTTFGHLASTSECVNAGTDVGLPYTGAAPDIGWTEYIPDDPPVDPIVIVVVNVSAGARQATIGCNVTDDGGGTVSDRGVCWSESADPTLSDSHNHNGTGTGAFNSYITGLLPITTYHVRAFATNEAGTGYSADSEFMTTSDAGLSGDIVFDFSTDKSIWVKIDGVWYIVIH